MDASTTPPIEITEPKTDEFGREVVKDSHPNEQQSISEPFPPKRLTIDATLELGAFQNLSHENLNIAKTIAEKVVHICNSTARFGTQEIEALAGLLFKEFARETDILFDVLIESTMRMSPQVECIAALTAYYIINFSNGYQSTVITKIIPQKLKEEFKKDHFRTVKLLLRFLATFERYNLLSSGSYCSLLLTLAKTIEKASEFRAEAISRALIVACKMSKLDSSIKEQFVGYVEAYLKDRDPKIVDNLAPINKIQNTFLGTLFGADDYYDLSETYVSLFENNDTVKPIDIPEIEFEFGDVDLSQFPLILLQNDITENSYNPLIADIADDILVFFGNDANLAAAQMCALPMLLKFVSLRINGNEESPSISILKLICNVIMSDVLKIPNPYHPTVFHVQLLLNLIELTKEWSIPIVKICFSQIIIDIVSTISKLDAGLYSRFVNFFVHYISVIDFEWCWNKWGQFTQYAENDLRFMFIKDVIDQCYNVSDESYFKSEMSRFQSIWPPIRKLHFKFGEGTEYETRSTQIRKKLLESPDVLEKELKELVGLSGDFDALKILITNIFNSGNLSPSNTISCIEKFSDLIHESYNEEWKSKLLIACTLEFYTDFPPMIQQILGYLLTMKYCSVKSLLSYYFDSTENIITNYKNWPTLILILETVISNYIHNNQNDEAKEVLKEFYKYASEFYAKKDLSLVSNKFFIGNLKHLGREFYYVYKTISEDVTKLISENSNQDFSVAISSLNWQIQ